MTDDLARSRTLLAEARDTISRYAIEIHEKDVSAEAIGLMLESKTREFDRYKDSQSKILELSMIEVRAECTRELEVRDREIAGLRSEIGRRLDEIDRMAEAAVKATRWKTNYAWE